MTYTQKNFKPSDHPNVWERYYPLADGTVLVVSHVDIGKEDNNYVITIHSVTPPKGDWWDTVIREVDYVCTLDEAEAVVAELIA